MNLAEFERQLRLDIPLAAALDVRLRSVDENAVEVAAPLAPNLNHEGTAFGGSLFAVGALAGYALVFHLVRDLKVGYLVLQKSEIDYRKPVTGDFTARATWGADRARFANTLRRKGVARVSIEIDLREGEHVRARMTARFVAGKTPGSSA